MSLSGSLDPHLLHYREISLCISQRNKVLSNLIYANAIECWVLTDIWIVSVWLCKHLKVSNVLSAMLNSR